MLLNDLQVVFFCSGKDVLDNISFLPPLLNLKSNIGIFILHTVHQYISFGTDKENLLNNQSFLGW